MVIESDPPDPAATPGPEEAEATAESFSEGIIRFYRARTILDRGGTDADCELAWTYLRDLEPEHLPPDARSAFGKLVGLMFRQALEDEPDYAVFRRSVLHIAAIVDAFIDSEDA